MVEIIRQIIDHRSETYVGLGSSNPLKDMQISLQTKLYLITSTRMTLYISTDMAYVLKCFMLFL